MLGGIRVCGVEAARSFSTSISDTYWCSPHAHASRVMRTRALATCVMAEPRALYGMCSKADTYAARDTCMDLSITMYLRPSRAAADSPRMVNVFSSRRPAKLRSSRGMYSAGHVGARGASALIDVGQTPERACGTLDRSPRHSPGFFAGRFVCQFWCGRFMSCRGVRAKYVRCLGWPYRKRSEAVSGPS